VAQQTLQAQSSVQTVAPNCRLQLSVQNATLKFKQEPSSVRTAEPNYSFFFFYFFYITIQMMALVRGVLEAHAIVMSMND
jgi:hypothetical protein